MAQESSLQAKLKETSLRLDGIQADRDALQAQLNSIGQRPRSNLIEAQFAIERRRLTGNSTAKESSEQ